MSLEHKILKSIAKTRHDIFTKIMKFFSLSANAGVIFFILSLIMILSEKYKKMGYACIVTVLTHSFICNVLLKPVIKRMRPFDRYQDIIVLLDKMPKDYSFPSGHTGASFAFATTVFLYDKKLGALAYILALCIAYSRMYLGVHYPTDIIGGVILGSGIAILIFNFFPLEKFLLMLKIVV